jgi:DNA-directed RNA polymerase specialized sigma24 family protein
VLLTRTTRPRRPVPWETPAVTLRARNDDELLVDVGTGDHQAFATLYDHLAGLVYANILRVLHDTTRTDTVADEAFIEVWRQAAGFDPSRTPASMWVLDLAHQHATERARYEGLLASTGRGADREAIHPSRTATSARPSGHEPAPTIWGCVPRVGVISPQR